MEAKRQQERSVGDNIWGMSRQVPNWDSGSESGGESSMGLRLKLLAAPIATMLARNKVNNCTAVQMEGSV